MSSEPPPRRTEPAITMVRQGRCRMSHEILDLSGKDADRLPEKQFAILPLGSIEYHGPPRVSWHRYDPRLGIARRVGRHFDAIIYPPITYTFAPTITSAYPGTISISPETMLAYVTEILHEIVRCGIHRIVALNAHSETSTSCGLRRRRSPPGSPRPAF